MFSVAARDDEQRLAERLRSADSAAMREFYACYADLLAAVCARYVVDEEDVKDVFQDALVRIFTHAGDFHYRGPGSLRAWVTKIAVNESLRFLQASHRLTLQQLTTDIGQPEPETDDPPISDVPPEVVHQMVSRLPVGYRTVFNLYVFEGHSHSDIARLLDISKSTSTSQLHRAKRLLAKMITDYLNHKQSSR